MNALFRSAPRMTFGYWAPVACYIALIWLASSMSSIPVDLGAVPGLDKLAHALEFAGLGWLLTLAIRRTTVQTIRRHSWLAAAVFVLLCGWLDEIHQAFVPGREVTVWDVAADVCGGMLGGLLCLWYLKAKASFRRQKACVT